MHFILLFAISLGTVHSADRDWRYHARRLTGFSDATHRDSLATLKKMRDLPALLPDALRGPDRYLALDVLSTLRFASLLPVLFEAIPEDESGAVALAVNALLTAENRPAIVQTYSKFLSDLSRKPLSVPTTLAILDVLARMRHPLPEELVEGLMSHPAPMVRSAAVYFARMLRSGSSEDRYRAVLERGLRDPTQYIRVQTQAAAGSTFAKRPETVWTKFAELFNPSGIRESWPQAAPPRDLVSLHAQALPQTPRQKQVCDKTYNHFYKNDRTDIRIAFGYKDARPSRFVGDRYEAAWFASYLTAPCQADWFACGFSRDSTDPGLFRKLIVGPEGKARDVRVTLVSSAAGADDDENRNDVFQKWLSERASAAFLDGIEKADAVFYDGHSRDGGGPDFAPPRLAPDKHVDYDWYAKNKPGMGPLLERLGKSQLPLLGFFSCASTGHFMKVIQETNPKVGTITSPKLIYYTDSMKNMLAALSALLGRKCETDFHSSLRAKVEVGDSHLDGFFRAD
jgi:hypothetical protein